VGKTHLTCLPLEDNGFREAIEDSLLEHLDVAFEEESVDDYRRMTCMWRGVKRPRGALLGVRFS
jgi:hypothetical protein